MPQRALEILYLVEIVVPAYLPLVWDGDIIDLQAGNSGIYAMTPTSVTPVTVRLPVLPTCADEIDLVIDWEPTEILRANEVFS
jgi:hypothetical protein